MGERVVEVLKQAQNSPMKTADQVVIIYAVVNNLLKDVNTEDITEFQNGLLGFIDERYPSITESIEKTKDLTAENEEQIRKAIDDYKKVFAGKRQG